MRYTRNFWLRLRHQVGYRGGILLFFGMFDLLYALTLIFPDSSSARSPQFRYYDEWVGHESLGIVWFGVGLFLIWESFRKDDRAGYAVASVVKLWWVLFHAIAWFVVPDYDRAYVNSLIFLVFSLLVFMESSRPEPSHSFDEPQSDGEDRS